MTAWFVWAIAIVGLTAAGLVALLALQGGQSDRAVATPSDTAALQAYVTAIKAPTAAGGEVVGAEMRPSLRDFEAGAVDGATFTRRARGWQLALLRAQGRFDTVPTPPSVAAARPLFDAAFQGYEQAADTLAQAGGATGVARAQLVDRAVATARAADHSYDRAGALVQAALRAAHLPADADLPDPTPTPGT